MIEVKGKYGSAKIFTDLVEQESISQVITMLNQPFAQGQTIRMMPDIHAGAGCTVGTTMTVTDKVCPNLIGVDIGCGMYAVQLNETEIDFRLLDVCIRQYIPSGFNIHESPVAMADAINLDELFCANSCNLDRAKASIGSLGGGNHFIEVDRDENGRLWLVIHSGSRHLGTEVASYYQKQAIKNLHDTPKDLIQNIIRQLKAEGRQSEIQTAIQALTPPGAKVPDALCWCDGYLFDHYVHDVNFSRLKSRACKVAFGTDYKNQLSHSITTPHQVLTSLPEVCAPWYTAASAARFHRYRLYGWLPG